MRGILLVVFASVITGAVAVFVFHGGGLREISKQQAGIGGLTKTVPLSEVTDEPLGPASVESDSISAGKSAPDGFEEYIQAADKYLEEALPIIDSKQRFVLIERINSFKDSYESAVKLTGSDSVNFESMIGLTARYIAMWSPFYYYIHQDAQSVLGPIIKMLERERAEMLGDFAGTNARKAGELATKDIEYYIEDIRKSAARRNSDFIIFSLQDYERYRKTFDEITQDHPEFLKGFARKAHILSDNFYRMHEEVDPDYLDKTRKKVEDVRLGLRELHKQALLALGTADEEDARAALAETIAVIESELSAHSDWRNEIHDIIEDDYEFYKDIQL